MSDIYALGQNSMAVDWAKEYVAEKAIRLPYESDWRTVARLGLPRHYSGWVTSNASPTTAGSGAARQARIDSYDTTLARSINIFAAVQERALTPGNQMYHTLRATDDRIQRRRAVALYFERLNKKLFTLRYDPYAGFAQAQGEVYVSLGGYGNACKMISWRDKDDRFRRAAGFRYANIPFRNMYWRQDANGILNIWFRRIDWTREQAMKELKERCPKIIVEASGSDTTRTWEFCQVVAPSEDWDARAMDRRRYALVSLYIFVQEPQIVVEPAGYRSNPLMTPREFTEGGIQYGYGAAQLTLSSVGSANAQSKSMLRYGQRASEPVLLTADDGVLNGQVDLTPGSANPGGIDKQGRKMIATLELGNWQVNEKILEKTQADIKEPLFSAIFDLLKDRPQMTATEVLDVAGREAALLSPVMGRRQTEDLAINIEREIALLAENDALPEDVPAEMNDADYHPIYTSPLARAIHSEAVSGFMRVSEIAMNVAKLTGKTSILHRLNYDEALPSIAEQQGVPPSWMNMPEKVAQLDAEDAKQQQTQQTIDALPAAASINKTMSDKNPAQM